MKRLYAILFQNCQYKYLLYSLLIISVMLLLWQYTTLPSKQMPYTVPFTVIKSINDSLSLLPYNISSLPREDFSSLIDLIDFKFILNNFPCNCSNVNPFLLIVIHSAPQNFVKRYIIRNTWGQHFSTVSLLFFFGKTYSMRAQQQIDFENYMYNDIVQGDFYDSYKNMTYKHTMILKWITYFCSNVKYILKTDDDVFVNTPYLLKYLKSEISPLGAKKLILCYECLNSVVRRSYRSKWRISPLVYPEKIYPPYCYGFIIIYSLDVVFDLYKETQQTKYFWIDDVHITGTIAAKINLTHTLMGSLLLTNNELDWLLITATYSRNFLFGPPNLSSAAIERLWFIVDKFMHSPELIN